MINKHISKVYNGHADVFFSDAPKRGGPASIISYKAKIAKVNLDKEEIDYEGQVELKLKGGKNLLNVFSFKNIPREDSNALSFKVGIVVNRSRSNLANHLDFIDLHSLL